MITYENLTIIGTSHIAKESVKKVKQHIEKSSPVIIALELDETRALSLLEQKKKTKRWRIMRKWGLKIMILNTLGSWVEKYLTKATGISPGSEMKMALRLAKEKNIKIALIDQPINITLKKLSAQLTTKEKGNFIKEIIFAPFRKKQAPFDLNTIPSQKIIDRLIQETKEKYPTFYKIIVKERDEYMAKALSKLMALEKEGKILAIVGAGHEKSIVKELKWMKNSKQ